jgi:hypothetical protein
MKEQLEDILNDLEWAYDTLKYKETFGMDEEQAIKFRERRSRGVFLTSIKEIKQIIQELEQK